MFSELEEIIEAHSVFFITTHVNPDGDSIGSELALKNYLESRGKSAFIINASDTPPELEFLDPDNTIITVPGEKDLPECDVLFSLDTALISRFENLEAFIDLNNTNIFPIDHHIPDNESLSGLIDPQASSTGEILYRYLSEAVGDPLPKELAEPLFYAIASDTGWMQFSNTSSSILRICADLADAADLNFCGSYNRLKNSWSHDKFRLYTEVISTLDVSDDFCAFIHCDQDTFAGYPSLFNLSHSTEAFVEDLKRLYEYEVYILLKQKDDKTGYRVSLRSRGTVDVQKLASAFGGGGHIMASGCTIDMPDVQEVKKALRKKLEEQR